MAQDQITEYPPTEPFPGVVGRTLDTSSPAWPAPKRARQGSPNVVVVLWDDVGFGQLSPFGGSCETPTLDRIAARGLRYSNFHTTALCTPTRGCLMTGRNHHSLGLSAITETSLGFPAHNSFIGFEHGFLPEMLLEHGYNTFAIGKWHLTAPTESTTAGPFNRWPLGRGFERFYGFLAGSTDHWYPDLVYDNHPIPAPATPEDGYHLNIDLADHAIQFIKDAHVHAPDKPFLLYYALGAGHSPHHVEPEWIDKYAGRFDAGWDEYRRIVFERQLAEGIVPPDTVLSERDPDVPAWDSLRDDERRMYAREMEVYAGFIEQSDHHLGRVDRLHRRTRRARQHDHRGDVRQRRQRRGWRARHVQRGAVLQRGARDARQEHGVLRSLGWAGHVPALLVGLGVGGQHAVPPVEARDVPGRCDRPVHRVVARRHLGPR